MAWFTVCCIEKPRGTHTHTIWPKQKRKMTMNEIHTITIVGRIAPNKQNQTENNQIRYFSFVFTKFQEFRWLFTLFHHSIVLHSKSILLNEYRGGGGYRMRSTITPNANIVLNPIFAIIYCILSVHFRYWIRCRAGKKRSISMQSDCWTQSQMGQFRRRN